MNPINTYPEKPTKSTLGSSHGFVTNNIEHPQFHVINSVNKNGFEPTQKSNQLILVGLGPHSKRIYMHFLKQANSSPDIVVELKSREHATRHYLTENNIRTKLLLIPDTERDQETLSTNTIRTLKRAIEQHKITKAIISTEPKSHLAYAYFFLSQEIDVLIDKPLSAPVHVSSDSLSALKIYNDFLKLNRTAKASKARCIVQCQRRYHPGYRYIRHLLKTVIEQFQVPITHLSIYHCDGLWNMPSEYQSRENHPYKYGYGKLMHSGYHFVDLFCWISELNNLIPRKTPNSIQLFHQICQPVDCLFQLDKFNYQHLFGDNNFDKFFDSFNPLDYKNFGEVDSYTQLQLLQNHKTVLTGSLHLLQNGFSRRSWQYLPEDTYKSNGRIRHEQVNIQLGPLLNIQVHSYESHEINDLNRVEPTWAVGGLEHFEIFVFRNTSVIGGLPFERIELGANSTLSSGYIGHNEEARNHCLSDFLNPSSDFKVSISDIQTHAYTNWLLSQIHLATCKKREDSIPVIDTVLPKF